MTLRMALVLVLLTLVLLVTAPALAHEPGTSSPEQAPGDQAAGPQALTLYFYRDGQIVPVARAGILSGDAGQDAARLLAALLAGPTAAERSAGLSSALPAGAKLADVATAGEAVTVDLWLPDDFVRDELDPARSDAAVDQIVKTLHPLGLNRVLVRAAVAEAQEKAFVPLSDFVSWPVLPTPTTPANDDPLPDRPGPAGHPGPEGGQPPLPGQGQPRGALSGKAVWLSAGHGWYWSETLNRWNTQRGNNYGLIEDFSNAEAVNYYLARYLWNAGADTWLVRERSMIEQEVIVDDDDGAPAYVETGTWQTSLSPGYQEGTYRFASTLAGGTASATWTPDLPQAGWYAVWAWYRHGDNRTVDARYEVHHAGGVTPVSISQEVHGLTWRYLGEYYFESGTGGSVTLLNDSSDPGQAVIADAVRFGGGLGSVAEPGGTSGRPRWEEQATYWAHYQGAPIEPSDYDPSARPLYAEWEAARGEPGEAAEAVYLSWHSNAGGATGTDSFVDASEPTPGSLELQDWVHDELIHDLRAGWDPEWVNRGQKAADFSEVHGLSTMPGLLLEVAFHDSEDPGDADDLKEPLFRQIAARAVYQGIVKYYAARAGTAVHLLPEPPERLAARSTGPGQVTLTWAAGARRTARRLAPLFPGDGPQCRRRVVSHPGGGRAHPTGRRGTGFPHRRRL
ncbi:MAG: GerMN domain-containing protein [Anaerolineae bacterium]